MAQVKKITLDYAESGRTVYCIIRREADAYRLNDADGAFASAPADPYITMSEDSVIKGRYELSESRTAWNDGKYSVAIYKQLGGSPAPASDIIIGTGELHIAADLEITPSTIHDKVLELREGNVKLAFTYATEQNLTRNVDIGRLDYITVKIKADSAANWDAPISTKNKYMWYTNLGDVNPAAVGEAG